MRIWGCIVGATLACAMGCGSSDPERNWPSESDPGPVPAYEQREGDPVAGYNALINAGIVRCGIPLSAYSQVFGPAPANQRVDGRTGLNETLPYNFTATTTSSGVDIVSANCLTCHAEYLNGRLVIGLGNSTSDFTGDDANLAVLARAFVDDETEREELEKFIDRLVTIAPYTQMSTRGVNPADNLAAILFAHRDRDTLQWSYEPLLEPPPMLGVPVDVPPWWRMRNKNAMFYVGAGRGDHARHMMAASSLCTDTVEEAEDIDRLMPDISAYLKTIEPPVYDGTIDDTLAAQGKETFDAMCSSCHGTYGDTPTSDDYPNLIVSVDDVGTDQTLAIGAAFFADTFVQWYNDSFFGENGYLAPAPGYYAPSLRGIWSTGPFFHNGSVPDIWLVLKSEERPRFWTRNFDSWDYDMDRLGWRYTELDHGKGGEPDERQKTVIYDTSGLGYGNAGHTYGDRLSDQDRWAVLEYLKTL